MSEIDQEQLLGTTIGERLIAARQAKGMTLEDVASQTRIPIRHLQHIERGEWDALPAITYSIGFARSYAKVVGLDGPAIGVELRNELGATRSNNAATAAYYEPADPARVPPRSIAIVAGVIAILLVIGYLVWRNGAVGDDPGAIESEIVDASPQGEPAPQPVAAQPNGNGSVALTAVEDVWLRIYEGGANGRALYQGTLKAGERYDVPATAQAPLLRTGRANMLRVTVGGVEVAALGPPERTIAGISLRGPDLVARTQAPVPPVTLPSPAGAPPSN